MTTNEFNQYNTSGYSDAELAALNSEWQDRATTLGVVPDDDEYDHEAKAFADAVARR